MPDRPLDGQAATVVFVAGPGGGACVTQALSPNGGTVIRG
jgi:hypothetical protein